MRKCHSRSCLSFPRRRESRGVNSGRNPRSGRIYATRKGVTLLEMIVIMAIIIIITAASMPSFLQFINTSRLRGSARDITTALRTARRYAITQRKNYAVTVYMHDHDDFPNAVSFYESAGSAELKYLPRTIKADCGTVKAVEYTFTPRGTLAGGLPPTIEVKNGDDPGDNYIEITVLNTTGRVKMGDIKQK